MLDENIFNTHHTYHPKTQSLFLQEKPGLVDSIHKYHPEIWRLYKKLKSLDWDENEFDFSSCMAEFKTCSKTHYEMMIKTIAWQWEADSIAAHNLIPIAAPFVSSSELWALWLEIGKNEMLHALTYSEIVKNSFEHPDDVLKSVLEETKALQRLKTISSIMSNVYRVSHHLALGELDRESDEAYDAIFMMVIAMLVLERIQFMASFEITFAIADTGLFLPIGKAVQKICTDEYQIHVEAGREILRNELKTEKGLAAFERNRHLIETAIQEVVQAELNWTDYLFEDNRELVGVTKEMIKDGVLFNASDVYTFLSLNNPFKIVNKNPLPYMDDWVDINKNQASPQEEKNGNYLLGGLKDTLNDKVIMLDF